MEKEGLPPHLIADATTYRLVTRQFRLICHRFVANLLTVRFFW